MGEKMKFCEAALKMKENDVFKPTDHSPGIMLSDDGSFNLFEKGGAIVMLSQQYLNLEGEIIPAEPKVLTIKELYNKCYEDEGNKPPVLGEFTKDMLKKFHQNGRFERDIELSALVSYQEHLISVLNEYGCHASAGKLEEIIRNLKPLNPDENS
jgi:hypothetical protein